MYRLLPLRISEPFISPDVELLQVEVLCFEVSEALFCVRDDPIRGKSLPRCGPRFGRPAAAFRWNLGGDKDTATNFLEGPGDQSFAVPIAIGVRGIDKGEAQLQRPRQSPDREGVVGFAPPPLADPPGPKTDLRYLNACASKPAMLHARSPQDLRAILELLGSILDLIGELVNQRKVLASPQIG